MSEAKQAILSRIRESIAYNAHIPNETTMYTNTLQLQGEDLLENFKTNHTNNKAIVVETQKSQLENTLNEILEQNATNNRQVLYNPDVEANMHSLSSFEMIAYTKSIDSMRDMLFGITTSVVQARCGIADLGIIALSSSPNAPRLSSLIATTCIYLLSKDNIVPHLFAGIEFVKAYEKQRSKSDILPSNIIFVAGPSRTADIELQTVFGVHGPRKTYVILY